MVSGDGHGGGHLGLTAHAGARLDTILVVVVVVGISVERTLLRPSAASKEYIA